jgi:hypothetical protein
MTPTRLLEVLKEYIEGKTELLRFGEEDKGGRRQPQVFIGYPPAKTANVTPPPSPVPGVRPPTPNNQVIPQPQPQPDLQKIFYEDEKIYPFVLVRLLDWTDEKGELGDQATASVRLIFGVKTYDHSGYMDVTHLAQTIRQALLEDLVIGDAAEVQKPLLVTVYEDQEYPYWIADADVTFIIPTIVSNIMERTDFYGDGTKNRNNQDNQEFGGY